MNKNQIATARNRHSVHLKKSIASNRRRAIFTGLLYLLGTIGLTALACLPLLSGEVVLFENKRTLLLGVVEAITVFENLEMTNAVDVIVVVTTFLYLLMLFAFLINVIRALSKLKWLFKKKASRTYGFNRNVYAMAAMGDRFSGTFTGILAFHLIFNVLCGEVVYSEMLYIVLGVGIGLHILCGLLSGGVRLFHIEVGYGITEQSRESCILLPFIRSLLQCAVALVLPMLFLQNTTLDTLLPALYTADGFINMSVIESLGIEAFVTLILQLFTLIFIIALIHRAFTPIEFSIDGRFAYGIKRYRVRVFFVGLFAILVYVLRTVLGEATFAFDGVMTQEVLKPEETGFLIIGAIALVSFLIELILCRFPRTNAEKNGVSESGVYDSVTGETYGSVADTALSDDVDIDFYFNDRAAYPGIYYSGYEQNNGYIRY